MMFLQVKPNYTDFTCSNIYESYVNYIGLPADYKYQLYMSI